MRPRLSTLDHYLLANSGGTLASVFGIVISLMLFEHLPRLFDIVRLSGRKSYVIAQSMLSLLPEYAGIGLLFGLYLAIALTVRRLSLRGELDVIAATGVPTRRWMRWPAALAVLAAALLLWTQGWLMPAGERHLVDLGRQLEDGRFGYALQAGEFTDLGNGVTVKFDRIDAITGQLEGVFIHTGETTFTASRGRLGFDFGGDVLVDLDDGRTLDSGSGQSLSFSHFHLDSSQRSAGAGAGTDELGRRKATALPSLLASDKPPDRAWAWSRLLWPVFALIIPFAALVLGKPPRRSGSSLGLMAGLLIVMLFIRTAGLVATTRIDRPSIVAAGVATFWVAIVALLVQGERRWGAGYVDAALRRLGRRLGRARQRTKKEVPAVTEDQGPSRRLNDRTPGAPSWMQRAYERSSTPLIGEPTAPAARPRSAST